MALSRCSRCERLYYVNDSENPCRFHPGTFRNWWSCCRDPQRGAEGCRTAAHVEDLQATAMMDAFALSANICRQVPVPEAPSQGDEQPSADVVVIQQPGGELLMEVMPVVIEQPGGELCVEASPDAASALAAPTSPGAPTDDAARRPSASAGGGSGVRTTTMPYVFGVHDTFSGVCMRHRMTETELFNWITKYFK